MNLEVIAMVQARDIRNLEVEMDIKVWPKTHFGGKIMRI